jgi:hypothetical protein
MRRGAVSMATATARVDKGDPGEEPFALPWAAAMPDDCTNIDQEKQISVAC